MTTLCLCDWVETKADQERRLALNGTASPTDSRNTNAMAEQAAPPIAVHLMVPSRTPFQLEHLS